MTYPACVDDFKELNAHVTTTGGGVYYFSILKTFATSLTTPSIVGLFTDGEIKDCRFVENPSKYFQSGNFSGFDFAGVSINYDLNNLLISQSERARLVGREKSQVYAIRSDKDIKPYNLSNPEDGS